MTAETEKWAPPPKEFFLRDPRARYIRELCAQIIDSITAIRQTIHRGYLLSLETSVIADKLDELADAGVKPNIYGTTADNLPWEEIETDPSKTAEFAAGILLTLDAESIITNPEAALMIKEVGESQSNGEYKLPAQQTGRPDKLNRWIKQTALLAHVCELLDLPPTI